MYICDLFLLNLVCIQTEYEDVSARHEYEFGIHLHHIYIFLFSFGNYSETDNIRIVVQNMKYIYLHSTRLCTLKHTYIYLVQVNFD